MNDLEAVARDLRLSADSLKLPAELLSQGYDPSFLATYRPDELGQMDTATLARLKRRIDQQTRLADYKAKLRAQGESEGWWQASIDPVLDAAQTIAEIDGLTRNLRSRKSTRLLAAKDPRIAELGQAILTMSGSSPADLTTWVCERTQTSEEEGKRLLDETKHWLQVLLSEDMPLLHRLGRLILRKGQLSIQLLAEQAERETKEKSNPPDESVAQETVEIHSAVPNPVVAEVVTEEEDALAASYASIEHEPAVEPISSETSESVAIAATSETIEIVDPLLAAFPKAPAIKLKSAKSGKKPVIKIPAKQLSPRQRRRKWLRSILQRYAKLRVPLQRLGSYPALMLGRGHRSQIIAIKLDYDRQSMIQMAREALCPGPHPLNSFLMEVAEEALQKLILPRLEHDVFAEIEESAHHELTEMAVRHLQEMLQQRPVRGHRILVIDAVGPKTAAVAIVDPNGHVDFTGELSSVSSRPDIVAQNVLTLGQWIHQYRVSLVAISNGNTRRYLIHTVNELMKQSRDTDLRWTLVDRTGADAYCETRQSLLELPKIAKRFRAAVWLGWRLQDPLIELTKVDPARLRLGSYQRELPQAELEAALLQAVSACVAARGIDVWHSHEKALICLPGIDTALARAIVALRDQHQITTREKLMEDLKPHATETQLRQAIGYLRIFDSPQPLDGTMIHPSDYRLAERLVAAGPLTQPPSAPEGWRKPPSTIEGEVPSSSEAATASLSNEDSAAPAEALIADAAVAEATTEEPAIEETAIEEALSAPSAEESVVADARAVTTSEATNATPENSPQATAETHKVESSLAPIHPQNPTEPALAPPLTIDVERLARSWQVGREKMRVVARSLQQPFADTRDARVPIPLLSQVPTLDSLQPGTTAWGIVIGVADFGAFVDLGPDCNGLIHVSRLSREFVEDPHEVVQIGDLLQVWVVNVDKEKKRVALTALPPGVEQARRATGEESQRAGAGSPNRGFAGNRSGGSRPTGAGQDRNQGGSPSRGGRPDGQGQRKQGQRGGGPNYQGASQKGSGRSGGRSRNERRSEGESSNENIVRRAAKPAPPAAPISEAMQEGREPLRSFSDLMQFYQGKRDDSGKPDTPPTVNPSEPSDSTEPVVEETESNPNA